MATVQGNQLVLSGGATIGSTQTNTWGVAVTGTTSVTLTDDTNDLITPGSAGISYTDSSGVTNNSLDFASGGRWAANGAGGTLLQLRDSIRAVETALAGSSNTDASITSGTLTVGTGVASLTIGNTAVETGTGVSSSTTGWTDFKAPLPLTLRIRSAFR